MRPKFSTSCCRKGEKQQVENPQFRTMWLTVNRLCNLRCKWCYAEGTRFKPEDDMSLETAKNLIDMASDLGIKQIIIIGGEPTFWKHLFKLIQYIDDKKIMSTLVTNGYLFSNDNFLAKVKESSLKVISISFKAASREQYIELTGVDGFHNVLDGIEKAGKLENKEVHVSFVLSRLTVDSIRELPRVLMKHGAKFLSFDMCTPAFCNRKIDEGYTLTPNEYVRAIVDNADEISEIMDGNFSAAQQTLGCIWPKKILQRLIDEGKVTTGSCQMSGENGIIFTTAAELIPCNALYEYSLGKFGVEFNDAKSFIEYRKSHLVNEFFKRIKTYPKTECIDCTEHADCIGGCPLQWLIFDPAEIKNEHETFENETKKEVVK